MLHPDDAQRLGDAYGTEDAFVAVEQAAARVDALDAAAVDRALTCLVCVPVRTPGARVNRDRLRRLVAADPDRARAFLAHSF